MSNDLVGTIIGIIGAAVGLVGIGYGMSQRDKMNENPISLRRVL